MKLNEVDRAIMNSIETVRWSTGDNPLFCSWMPSMRTREGIALADVELAYPALIHFVEYKDSPPNKDGSVTRHIQLYICNPKPKNDDVIKTMQIWDRLDDCIDSFMQNLRKEYNFTIGERSRYINQIPTVMEAGIWFELYINVPERCRM